MKSFVCVVCVCGVCVCVVFQVYKISLWDIFGPHQENSL